MCYASIRNKPAVEREAALLAAERRVFFSFHYEGDACRVAQIRDSGELPLICNDWESIKVGSDAAIAQWVDSQMRTTSCTVVLIGNETANREWIHHEIEKSWNDGKGLLGIYIHNLKDQFGKQSIKGENPFDSIRFVTDGLPLSRVVKSYNPAYNDDQYVYNIIVHSIENWVKEAIQIRNKHPKRNEKAIAIQPGFRGCNSTFVHTAGHHPADGQQQLILQDTMCRAGDRDSGGGSRE